MDIERGSLHSDAEIRAKMERKSLVSGLTVSFTWDILRGKGNIWG